MNKEQREMLEKLDDLKVDMKNFLDSNDVENAKAKQSEIVALKEKIELYASLEDEVNYENKGMVNLTMENKNTNKEFNNAILGKDYDNALVKRGVDADGGYLVPQEQANVIEEFKRQQISLKQYCRVIPTVSGKGVMPIEVQAGMMLANLTEGEEIPQSQIKFGQIKYDVATYADIIPVSNIVLQDENCNLMTFIGNRFAKKSVFTENAKILAIVKATENEVALANTAKDADIVKALNNCLNVKLDPAQSMNAKVIVNQTAFDRLDNMVDANGRALLEVSLQDATKLVYKGREVIVLSDAELANDEANAIEIYVVDMEAIAFFDRQGYEVAISSEAGFTKAITYCRVMERFDIKGTDAKAIAKVVVAKA